MNEKKYFRFKSEKINVVYAFPAKIRVLIGSGKTIETIGFGVEQLQDDEDYEVITESEFLQVFNEVQNEITVSYHNQFSKENQFIKDEQLKSEGY